MSEELRMIDDWKARLGLTWAVKYQFSQVDRPQIASSKHTKEHLITMPLWYSGRPVGEQLVDAGHEFIHALFSERIDPIFASIYIHPGYDLETAENRLHARELYYAQEVVDVWVQDHLQNAAPELTKPDIESWFSGVLSLRPEGHLAAPYEVIVGFALNEAQITRSHLHGYAQERREVERRIKAVFGSTGVQLARRLSGLYTSMPRMRLDDRERAIFLLERETRMAARIMGFSITPSLVTQEEQLVWRFSPEENRMA